MPRQSNSKFRKGPRKGWTTPEQLSWLHDQGSEYLTVKGKGQRGQSCFWTNLFDTWFERWPETAEDPGATQKVCIIV